MREMMTAALHRIDRDPQGVPIKLYPFTRSTIDDAPALIVIDPTLAAGRPVLKGTGLVPIYISSSQWHSIPVADLESLDKELTHCFRYYGSDEFVRVTLKAGVFAVVLDGFEGAEEDCL